MYRKHINTQAGGSVQRRKIHDLSEIADDFDLVVNCGGLGARQLFKDDKLYPVRYNHNNQDYIAWQRPIVKYLKGKLAMHARHDTCAKESLNMRYVCIAVAGMYRPALSSHAACR